MKISLGVLNERLDAFEQSVDSRFGTLGSRLNSFEQSVNDRFESQDQKLDQVLLLLNTLIPKSEQDK